ncbi:MAG: methylmalonyl-CoA mutase [Gammaproteobacteria bacterium]|jgi:methylmalonyl-CoA mutase C-terminal domain/subunit|nr:methylmalonyl-CoA mutase [Gammaproteobacteria bacterium]|tara:strand:- start:308 stop:703 length:396 start_codon:yes stop_codon:yes gene_type:complete
MSGKPLRVLISKPGLDGHDVGARIVARSLMNAGFEVIYTGLRKSAREIATTSRDEDVDVIGMSMLAGSHIPFCTDFAGIRVEFGIADRTWLLGGNIPKRDEGELRKLGVDGIFPTGSSLESIAEFIRRKKS